jgi:16S rRNA (cytosine1402-N4)-methyltransferase
VTTDSIHVPVLSDRVLELLGVRPGGRYVDATVDGGGHAAAVLAASAPDGCVLGIDRDGEILEHTRRRLAAEVGAGRLRLAHGDFRRLADVCGRHSFAAVDGILFDLGLSSFHLDASGRGFAVARNEPLDMRFDPTEERSTAAHLLANAPTEELASIFRDLGEERFASRIARSIVAQRRNRPLRTSTDLLAVVERSLPPKLRWRAQRNAARVFQALRIAVNQELEAVREALSQTVSLLRPGGRLVVISFHSLEDRIVKSFLREQRDAGRLALLTRKPLRPDQNEIAANPRSASAKLRAAERC